MKLKEQSKKAGLKFNIQKTKIMASGPISSVQLLSCVLLFVTPWMSGFLHHILELAQIHFH